MDDLNGVPLPAELIAYLNDKIKELEIMVASVAHEIANTQERDLVDYYACMMMELETVRDDLDLALTCALLAHVKDISSPDNFVN